MNIYKAIEHCVSGLPDSGYHSDNPLNTAVKDVKALVAAYNALAPTPEMWADAPEWAQWYTIDPNGDAWLDKDEPSTGMREWKTYSDEYVVIHTVNLPIGIDWRLCKWQRP